MTEEITLEEWGRRIFDEKRYKVTRFDYDKGRTWVMDNNGETYIVTWDNDKQKLILEEE